MNEGGSSEAKERGISLKEARGLGCKLVIWRRRRDLHGLAKPNNFSHSGCRLQRIMLTSVVFLTRYQTISDLCM